MYRSLLYRNFLSKKDNAMALMKPAEGMGRGKKIPLPFLLILHPFRSLLRKLALMFKAQHPN